jgi:hypothetical protein
MDDKIRQYEVNEDQILTIPLMSIQQMEIATDDEAVRYVKEVIHHQHSYGYPLVEMYKKNGIILHPIDATNAHVLLVINERSVLNTLAIFNHVYNRIGYNLIIDTSTVLRSPFPSSSDNSNEEMSEQLPSKVDSKVESSEENFPQDVSSEQLKTDVVGMEVA